MSNELTNPVNVRELMRVAGDTLVRDAGDDRADIEFSIRRTVEVLRLIRAELHDRNAAKSN